MTEPLSDTARPKAEIERMEIVRRDAKTGEVLGTIVVDKDGTVKELPCP